MLAVGALLVSACTVKEAEGPRLTGPSELGTSITVLANPDVLTQDGFSQSRIVIQARDAAGLPIRDLAVRIEINVQGVRMDFGRLSARWSRASTVGPCSPTRSHRRPSSRSTRSP